MKILVVEPETLITQIIKRVLTDRVAEIHRTIAAVEALEQIAQNAYDLIVVDVGQQGLDGIEFCRQVRSQGWTMPILALTRRRGQDKTMMALQAGATDCIAYPFNGDEFLWRINNLSQSPSATVLEPLQSQGRSQAERVQPSNDRASEIENDRQQAETALRESEVLYRTLFNTTEEGLCLLERLPLRPDGLRDYRFVTMNLPMQRMFGIPDWGGESMRGHCSDESEAWYDDYDRVLETGEAIRVEREFKAQNLVIELLISRVEHPSGHRLLAIMHNITDRKRREAHQRFLAEMSEELSRLVTASAMMQAVGAKIGGFLNISNCLFAEIDEAQDQAIVTDTWHTLDTPDVTGEYRLSDFITEEFRQAGRTGETIVIRDTQTDPRTDADRYAALQIRAFVTVPFHREGTWKYVFAVNDAVARDWRDDEIELIREVTNRIFPRLERAHAEATLQASEAKYRSLFNSIDEGFTIIEVFPDEQGRVTDLIYRETNPVFERQTGMRDAIGKRASEVLPNIEPELLDLMTAVYQTGSPVRSEQFVADLDRWYTFQYSRVGGAGSRFIAAVFDDISDRKQAEAQLHRTAEINGFRVTLADALRPLRDPAEIQLTASQLLGDYLGANRVVYFEIQGTDYVVERDYVRGGATPLRGRYPITSFSPTVLAAQQAGRTISMADVAASPDLSPDHKAAYSAIQVAAHLDISLVKGGEFVAGLAIHASEPREWTPEEVRLSEEVAERTWAAVERAKAEAIVAADLRDTQLLQTLSTRLITETNIQVFYDEIMATAIALMQADKGSLQILDREQNELVLNTFQGFHPVIAAFWERVKLGGGSACSLALEQAERVIVPDVETCDFLAGTEDLEFYRFCNIRAMQSTPLISRSGQVIGMFSTHWHNPYHPSDRELKFLDLLARQAADWIEQQQSSLVLQASETILRLALEGAKAGTWDWDLSTNKLVWSLETYVLQGYDPAEGLPVYDQWYNTRLHPDDRLWVRDFTEQVLAQQQSDFQIEFRILHPEQGVRWLLSIGHLTLSDRGEPLRISGINLDITDRKGAELALQQQIRQEYLLADMGLDIRQSLDLEEVLSRTVNRVREVLHSDRVIIFRFRPNWEGDVIRESVGAECQPILGVVIDDPCFRQHCVDPYQQGRVSCVADVENTDLDPCYSNLLRSLQIKASLVVPILQNKHLWGLLIAHQCKKPRHWQDAEIHLLKRLATQVGIAIQQAELYQNLQDELRDRQRAEHKIHEQAALLDITTDAIFVQDLENRIIYWNRGAERLYGWSATEAIGQLAPELLQENTFTVSSFLEHLQHLTETGEWQGEVQHLTKAGKAVTIATRWTLTRKGKNGETNQPQSILVVNTDITEKKQLEAQFYHAQRLESLGTLASGIAHDLNNVFTPILAGSQLLQLQLQSQLPPQSIDLLKLLEQAAKRGAGLIKQILTFSRGTNDDRVNLAVQPILEEVVNVMRSSLPPSIRIDVSVPEVFPWLIFANGTHIHQILMNLCINARDAMVEGGILSLSLDYYWIDQANLNSLAPIHFTANPGEYIRLTVADTGTGIAPEVRDRIFEPFFTTKPQDKGTGLGLSTVFGIVKTYGGFIHIRSEVGYGSSFQIYLPVIATELSEVLIPPSSPLFPTDGQQKLVLLIDDDEFQQMTLKAILAHHNYRIIATDDSTQAMDLYRQHQSEISAVIVDIMMPTISGLELILQLRDLMPKLTIIAISGLPSHREGAIGAGATSFLNKPYTPDTILNAVRQCP